MQNQSNARPGDILVFYRAHRWLDYFIMIFSRSRYYHVGLYAGDNKVLEARPQGVILDGLDGRGGGYTVVPAPGGRGSEALAWAKGRLGAKFDNKDFGVIFFEHIFVHLHINHKQAGHFSCTELVGEAYKAAGVDLFPGCDPDDIEPKQFAALGSINENDSKNQDRMKWFGRARGSHNAPS